MARVIQGTQTSWGPSIANRRFPREICATAWSSCSRFIAVACQWFPHIVILDGVTFEQLHTIHPPEEELDWKHITFSPGAHLLTAYSWIAKCIVSWDLQTGGLLSHISTKGSECKSVSYSRCGIMIGGSYNNNTITIYNVLSGVPISSHSIQQDIVGPIWTLGKYLQLATVEVGSITLWQVSFSSGHAPAQIGSLSTPYNFSSDELVLLPTLSYFAFILDGEVLVWDAQHDKVLLHSTDVKYPRNMSFSSNGHFFACGSWGREFYIWRESPTGYLPHQKLVSSGGPNRPLISPDGESVISSGEQTLQLWHIGDSPTHPFSILKQTSQYNGRFLVEFSPGESLVAITQKLSSMVTILDVKSGNPWFVIETGTKICGLRMTEDKIIVVGDGKIVTWDLPAGNIASNTQGNVTSCVQTTTFEHSAHISDLHASISPNLDCVAFGDGDFDTQENLCIYNIHTGKKLVACGSGGYTVGFTPSGHGVWCAAVDRVDQWEIIQGSGPNEIKLKKLQGSSEPQCLPWLSPCGHQVTNDGWVPHSSGKWLLWLPHNFWPDTRFEQKWSGKFLAVWNYDLSEPCILEFKM